tara:strand:- start:2505 stop:3311 length:807 start_codon:yes stop_codon:yes gene_type:complete
MITSTRIGRYGNTANAMFQFAAVIGMSKKTGIECAIPNHATYYEPNYGCINTSMWDGFDISIPELNLDISKFKEVEFPFEYANISIKDFTDMKGYFQTEKYFQYAKQEVKDQFKFKSSIKVDVDDKIENGYYPDPNTCTSIHIRLGDYTIKRGYHPAMTQEYYQTASKLSGSKNYMIFSDDLDACRRMLGAGSNIHYAEEVNPFAALYHMSLCSNHIICNSTFGWWGAWLGEMDNSSDDKKIIAPLNWFGDLHEYDSKDIVPDRWIKI